jgi:putative DNA primase/helicase
VPDYEDEDFRRVPLEAVAVQVLRDNAKSDRGSKSKGDGKHSATLLLPPPAAPMAVARVFVEQCGLSEGGEQTIQFWRGGWWVWRTSYWQEVDDRAMRSLLYKFTEHASYAGPKNTLAPWAPNRMRIGDLSEALSAVVFLAADIDQPTWLDGRKTGTIVAAANGLLDVERERLYPHTAAYFNAVAVPFDYDADALEPAKWLAFLDKLWPRQSEPRAEVSALGEWFGYIVSGKLNLHKAMLMVGPTRGGKGVIARILGALIGEQNVCGPTLSSLGGEFGLAPLLGKSLAVLSDTRSGKHSNSAIVVERLLSISGEDTLTVNRKFRDQWSGKLPCRLHIVSNELPRLDDASSAIVGRLVVLLLTESWLGKEDHGLEDALRAELAGILNWALEGLHRLTLTNRFTIVGTADEAINAMRDLASPVRAYVRENCELGGVFEIAVDHLYGDFKIWAENNGHAKISKQTFGRDLRAAFSVIGMKRPRTGEGDERVRFYVGIRLRPRDGS